MKVDELMTPNPECCTQDESIVDAARIMRNRDVGSVPVVESRDTRKVVGVVTDRDIAIRAVADGKDPDAVSCREVMTEEIVCCRPDDDISEVKRLMEERQLRRILVCDERGSLLGVVAIADLARELQARQVGETEQSIAEPSGRTPTA